MCIIHVNTPDSQVNYTFVQLTPEYKATLNIETSCALTVQGHVNCGKWMNIFIYKTQWLIILCLLPFMASAVRQHKFGNWGNEVIMSESPQCAFLCLT